jgi:hypothetical protein
MVAGTNESGVFILMRRRSVGRTISTGASPRGQAGSNRLLSPRRHSYAPRARPLSAPVITRDVALVLHAFAGAPATLARRVRRATSSVDCDGARSCAVATSSSSRMEASGRDNDVARRDTLRTTVAAISGRERLARSGAPTPGLRVRGEPRRPLPVFRVAPAAGTGFVRDARTLAPCFRQPDRNRPFAAGDFARSGRLSARRVSLPTYGPFHFALGFFPYLWHLGTFLSVSEPLLSRAIRR